MRILKWLVILLVVVGLGVGAWMWFGRSTEAPVEFRTAKVKRGDLAATISATGTVEPEEVVDVGAQVAGQILSFGTDADGHQVDFRSHVEEGMLLAQIDDVTYKSQVASATAQVKSARAGVLRANAELQSAEAKQMQATRDWERAQKLGPSEALAAFSYDAYKSGYEMSVAAVAVAKAAIAQAEASVEQAQAELDRASRNLGYCTIKSPVKGVVIARRVNIGQTVVASLNAPSLFLIAKDLKRIQVWVPVNEADVGQIRPGQPVTFTVDAFPGQSFKGEVGKVRLEPTITQNVVTYTVEVETANPDEILLPYLTANLKFITSEKKAVLSVSNSALRYTPAVELMVPEAREKYGATAAAPASGGPPGGGASGAGAPAGGPPAGGGPAAGGGGAGGGPRPAGGGAGRKGKGRSSGVVWIAADKGLLKPVEVKIGMTDGVDTELTGDELKEGDVVIAGEVPRDAAAPAGGTNPFAPQFPRGGSSGRSGR
ncbi:efflux RND transporter periplasmic adaptor subunit [Humisphaera borealis]|uniref:Efflux RND transporter periplasmic adaptor subunit n=1 Tax=Humisphaera borealis TaxID=2807512 RepID=A0A7M2WSU4_9BACT|nr:efflux RND transporter periplasmic adaptor subunit [Humisphaera borealis]QOV88503.1 efflux RND transporter periplasmic adaptor subunit [Humisphaera borealis]